MKPDLTLLYSQLGLKPDCSLAELKLAYRRRISELQPNHPDTGSQSPEASALLRNLVWLYATASRFHRRYGRLPGAAGGRVAHGSINVAHGSFNAVAIPRPYVTQEQTLSQDRQPVSARIAVGISFLLVVFLAGLLLFWWGGG